MTVSMFSASVPVFELGLTNLANLLTKAEAYALEKKFEPNILLNIRLYPDMLPLTRQVQIACDIVKGGAARLAGAEVPSFPDTETTFAELQARIAKTIVFIKSVSAKEIDASANKTITLQVGGNTLRFEGLPYLTNFVLPNLYFHSSITYAILRNQGVPLGKMDFLGAIQ